MIENKNKMKFESISIKQAISDIENNKIFLPPIQREFVWKKEQIINLFDSLYRKYPIGNCIFWNLESKTSRNYQLYKFIKECSEDKKIKILNERVPNNLLNQNVFAVVDGQQRLTSLFIGLAGVLKHKKGGKAIQSTDANYIDYKLYINLFESEIISDETPKIFSFLNDEDSSHLSDDKLWFEVGKILTCKNEKEAISFMSSILNRIEEKNKKSLIVKFEKNKENIITKLKTLFEMINDKRLYYFNTNCQSIDEVVEIFTRINSTGTLLKKSDLLFSLLISSWNEGRNEIKTIESHMRNNHVDIDKDFIMRTCLVLSDLPIKYKLETFTVKNINIIKDNWIKIKDSLIKICELLPEIGYVNKKNISVNALIPIAYYIKNGGNIKIQKTCENIQKYYMLSQVKSIYGTSGDSVLEKFRAEIKNQIENNIKFDFNRLAEIKLPGRRSLKININDLEELVENTSYKDHHAYHLLSLIYPTVNFKPIRYEVDHIHPKSKFNKTNLNSINIKDENTIKDWMENKSDLLPNLQLLAKKDNNSKRSKTIIEYLNLKEKNEKAAFIKENLLPNDLTLLELNKFDDFFNYRREKLIEKLKKHFEL